jgi:ABC-type transport system involved in cytochrome bd biosynthesis fused ATPase/permease subunit
MLRFLDLWISSLGHFFDVCPSLTITITTIIIILFTITTLIASVVVLTAIFTLFIRPTYSFSCDKKDSEAKANRKEVLLA